MSAFSSGNVLCRDGSYRPVVHVSWWPGSRGLRVCSIVVGWRRRRVVVMLHGWRVTRAMIAGRR